jgi:uncharacterized membrane protein YfcA
MGSLATFFGHVHVAGVAFGFLIGLSLGLLGGGGSILTVPVFVYVLGFGPKESIAMSLVVVGATSLVGAIVHRREGHVNLRAAATWGAVAVVGAFAGTRLAHSLTGTEQLTIFAAVTLVAAGLMLRGRRPDEPSRQDRRAPSVMLRAVQGLVVGLLTGLVGVGGGFLIVPALVWGGLAMCDAVGTSLVVITMNSAVSFLGYLGHVQMAWLSVALVTAGTLPGIATGAYAMRFVSQPVLRRGFAVLLFGVASYMLVRNHLG